MTILPTRAAMKVFAFAAALTTLHTTMSNAAAACRSFTVYTKNTERSATPGGPGGPLGDLVIASGLIYEAPFDGAPPVGTFDLSAITTSVNNTAERRQVFIETSFDKSFMRKPNKSRALCGTSQGFGVDSLAPTDDISLMGVETYPVGGGVLTTPIVLGISSGTGQFVGTEGSARISYDPVNQFFTYVFTFVPR